MTMIYFDNAATTRNKPKSVLDAYSYYLCEVGVSPGRGSYGLGIQASRMLYQSRTALAKYFGLEEPNTVFTKNSTEAINLFFNGFLKHGDHVIISPYEHNAVLRPLEDLKRRGVIDYSVISRSDLLLTPKQILDKYSKNTTVLIAVTLASNLTGRILFDPALFAEAKNRGISTFVDASQGAGKIKINMISDCIDYVAFTGHKDLHGVPGVGGLCSQSKLAFRPLIQGGTGILGHEKVNPSVYPEGYEAGTLNMPAIWALKAAIEHLSDKFPEYVEHEKNLSNYLSEKMSELENVIIYDKEYRRIDTLGINVSGMSSNQVVSYLDSYEICSRGGIHCAILAHESLDTEKTGVVRISLSYNNTFEEIDELVLAIKNIR